jgi:DNA polymerase-3 subunit delta'
MFEKIIAQDKAKKILSEQIKNNKIPHAYIFMGEEGTGKMLTAIEFAKILNCTINDYTKTDAGPCNHCLSCEHIDKGTFPDLHIINFEKQDEIADKESEKGKTKLGIKLIRYMQEKVYIKATDGKWKFFIIEPAEKMTIEAFNCLLKTLEEPPDNTIIILIAKHKETIPVTILSRSQTVFFQPLNSGEISKYLQDKHFLSLENANKIAESSDGSIEKAEKVMLNTQNEYSTLWTELTNKKLALADIITKSKSVAKDRDSAIEALSIISENATKFFRQNPRKYANIIEKLSESKRFLEQNANPTNVLDNLFIYINSKIKS